MLNATLIERIEAAPNILILQVKPDAGVPEFLPGQYVALGLPHSAPSLTGASTVVPGSPTDKLIKRAYSIGSPPEEREYLEFCVAVVESGELTSRIAALKPGDRLFCAAKITGTFTLDGVPEDHSLVFVATGTGVAPFIAMLRSPAVWTAGRKITLIHGVRLGRDLIYDRELKALGEQRPEFRYIPLVSRDPAFSGEQGRVQRLFNESIVPVEVARDHVFLCGNPAMITEMEEWLKGRGFIEHTRRTPGNLHLEKYW